MVVMGGIMEAMDVKISCADVEKGVSPKKFFVGAGQMEWVSPLREVQVVMERE